MGDGGNARTLLSSPLHGSRSIPRSHRHVRIVCQAAARPHQVPPALARSAVRKRIGTAVGHGIQGRRRQQRLLARSRSLPHKLHAGNAHRKGTVVRLRHVNTGKWLHSHLHRSPISGNLEVSAYDGGTVEGSDSGDNWEVNLDAGGKWKRDQRVRFKHVDTQHWLHSHDKRFGRPIAGQQEICAVQKKTNDALWFAGEGVYFPEREKPSAYLKTPHEDL